VRRGNTISCRNLPIALNTQFETWLQAKLNSGLRIGPPLAAWEDEFLCRGINENLFEIDANGEVQSELLAPGAGAEGSAAPYRIISESGRLLRENVCQLAAAARLVFERGWLRSHVSLEPGKPEQHATADQFDLLLKSPSGEILIWVEVRRTAVELHKLVADLRACSRRGPHAHADCGFPQNHPRHQFCVATRPAFLWAVAPDGELCFEVRCAEHTVELEPLASLPSRSFLEFG
jgi:hypothetical protein